MAHRLTRREFGIAAGAATLAGYGLGRNARAADTKTLRFIAQSDLRVLDPIWTTAYITRNHGYMVFDTLFAIDAEFAPHPQMVGDYSISPDKLTYQFKLRDGLRFHDGSPVRGVDCVASVKRWMARDGHGQALATVLDEIRPDGDKGFTIKLKEPFSLLLDGIGKVSSLALFVMPERLANTDPFQQVTEMVGSGPFKFVKDEFEPGHRVVYVKNTDYVPREEPPSWASGGKVVKVDRVEWLYIPDAMTKVAALNAGEADWWENPPLDIVPVLAANPDMTIAPADPLASTIMVRVQSPVAALRQRQDAPGRAGGRRPGRFPGGARRRPEELGFVPVILHLRHADGQRRRVECADRQARFRQGEEAGRRGRLQGREDRRARCGRSAGGAFAGARRQPNC